LRGFFKPGFLVVFQAFVVLKEKGTPGGCSLLLWLPPGHFCPGISIGVPEVIQPKLLSLVIVVLFLIRVRELLPSKNISRPFDIIPAPKGILIYGFAVTK